MAGSVGSPARSPQPDPSDVRAKYMPGGSPSAAFDAGPPEHRCLRYAKRRDPTTFAPDTPESVVLRLRAHTSK